MDLMQTGPDSYACIMYVHEDGGASLLRVSQPLRRSRSPYDCSDQRHRKRNAILRLSDHYSFIMFLVSRPLLMIPNKSTVFSS